MYVDKNISPSYIMWDEGKKAYFWKACKLFSMLHWQLMCNNTRLVVSSIERQHAIISDVHKGLGRSKARPMSSHCKRDTKISNRFFWRSIKGDVEEFIKKCDQCQKQGKIKKSIKRISWHPWGKSNRLVSISEAFLKLMLSSI